MVTSIDRENNIVRMQEYNVLAEEWTFFAPFLRNDAAISLHGYHITRLQRSPTPCYSFSQQVSFSNAHHKHQNVLKLGLATFSYS